MAEKKKEKLDQILNKLQEHDLRFDEFDRKFVAKEDLASLRADVVTRLDKVMGELEKAREDRVLAKAKDDKQDQRIGSLEGRVQKIEVKVG
jgi:uncharacterized coiled-coil DUF342 family protein